MKIPHAVIMPEDVLKGSTASVQKRGPEGHSYTPEDDETASGSSRMNRSDNRTAAEDLVYCMLIV